MAMPGTVRGVGLGLRGQHVPTILAERPAVPWFEIIADNYLNLHDPHARGIMHQQLSAIAADYPLTFHCVGMSLGSVGELDGAYFDALKLLIDELQPALVSDHLSFSQFQGQHFHDLLPLPYTEESLQWVIQQVDQVQQRLQRQVLLENPSTYVRFTHSTLSEADFLNALAEASGCGLLIDVNNCHVNAFNHQESALDFLHQLKPEHIKQAHLGGYEDRGDYLLDAHNNPVSEPVWALFEEFVHLFPGVPTLIEWDNELPEFSVLMEEKYRADAIIRTQNRERLHAVG